MNWSASEMMVAAAARELHDGEVIFVGIGLPNLACHLARLTHAPNLVLIYESGAIGARPDRLALSIGDPTLVTDSLMTCGMADVFQLFLQGGRIEVGFLGGAQVDRWGNINTTVLGEYAQPTVRLPGSGGAPEIAIHARRTLVIARLDRRAFPERVDFITSPGHLARGGTRAALGIPGMGPQRVITDGGILAPHPGTGELELAALCPGATVDQVRNGIGWDLAIRDPLPTLEPPTAHELQLLREVIDPKRLQLGRAISAPPPRHAPPSPPSR